MRNFSIPIIFIAFCITIVKCENFGHDSTSSNGGNSLLGVDNVNDLNDSLEKRTERYAFGLGRRAYTYTSGGSGVKRLPVYNFGLGKRARPYSFGLGKRDLDDDYTDMDSSYDRWSMVMPSRYDKYENIKRGRPFDFGLGKREVDREAMERRSAAQRYNFGLGRR